jgi:hypothetical protein
MGLPQLPQLNEHWRRQRHATLLITFADDADQAINAVDRRDLKRGCLTDAQAVCVHQQEADPGDRSLHATNERASLGVRQNTRQATALGRADSFFEKSAHARSSVRS